MVNLSELSTLCGSRPEAIHNITKVQSDGLSKAHVNLMYTKTGQDCAGTELLIFFTKNKKG